MYTPWAPDQCRNGHVYAPYKAQVGHHHCMCEGDAGTGGHLTYLCLVEGCGDEIRVGCRKQKNPVLPPPAAP